MDEDDVIIWLVLLNISIIWGILSTMWIIVDYLQKLNLLRIIHEQR